MFHPHVDRWFARRFSGPTEPQRLGWPAILEGRDTLIAAPTGSGKTLSAFLVSIDRLLRQAVDGALADETQVLYISPLKALSNDIRRNLELPLAEIRDEAIAAGDEPVPLRAMVRTGDTPSSERQKMLRRPPHILVTTPESLYLLLTSRKGRETLRSVRTVIVDEIHALARDKRGSHLALSLARLDAICEKRPQRIGLSATQRPIDEIARFLVGTANVDPGGEPRCAVVDVGHARSLDLAVEVPPSELTAVCTHEIWGEIYQRLTELIQSHRSTLVFVNTRKLAERVTFHLSSLLGEEAVASHHGSLSREIRLSAEQRLASGQLKAIVATASLELGIDVGMIDLVCQIGSPRSIAAFLQRVGRSGHSLGLVPKGRLFPLSRDELLECLALVRAVRAGRLDAIEIPVCPFDILAQQIVAETAAEERSEDELFDVCRAAWPFRNLSRGDFDRLLGLLTEGVARGSRHGAYLHRDQINGRVKARRGARIAALTSGGAIPETGDYRVVTEGDGTFVGTLNEDFAIESNTGDIFLLGNTSWRVRYVGAGEVVVKDAEGAPPTIPFWIGEAPGRTVELSAEVSRLREDLAAAVSSASDSSFLLPPSSFPLFLSDECGASPSAAEQALRYIAAQVAAMGLVPTQRRIVFERFFDEAGGMQLVIHSPLGSRINRAWGLAMRKRFCRSFDFELQASADDNGIVLSLGPQHSFPLEDLFRMLNPNNGRALLEQALLAAPMFKIRWRWNATRSLAVLRQQGGRKVPPPLQRFRAEDLIAAVFPATAGCLENHSGDLEIPDHPLVRQTMHDCLHEAMDLDRWLAALADIESGQIELIPCDTREPSPFSHQILNANPYAFLDDAPLEERRARAVATRRTLDPADFQDLARLDPQAIAQVAAEAWPTVRDADELHDALLLLGVLPARGGPARSASFEGADEWQGFFDSLAAQGRATVATCASGNRMWLAAERIPLIEAVYPGATFAPAVELPERLRASWDTVEATASIVRGWIESSGPTTAEDLAAVLGLRSTAVFAALERLEGEGIVLRGKFTVGIWDLGFGISGPGDTPSQDGEQGLSTGSPNSKSQIPNPIRPPEFCERRLLARIHRLTLSGARRQIQPVSRSDFLRFLVRHQYVHPSTHLEGKKGLLDAIHALQGFEVPAGSWERDLLPARVIDYDPGWLDTLSLSGEVAWGRLAPPRKDDDALPTGSGMNRVVPAALVSRSDIGWLLPPDRGDPARYARGNALLVHDALAAHGASFPQDLIAFTGLLPAQVDDALSELAALGLVTADGFGAIRRLVAPAENRRRMVRRQGRRRIERSGALTGGRWSRFPIAAVTAPTDRVERWAWLLVDRYGVVFRDLLARESVAPAWSELVPIYRRLEARGQLRGGRFVSQVGGEQFARSETIERLRKVRDEPPGPGWVVVSAADPLNLAGILTSGARVPAVLTNAVAIRNGEVLGIRQSGETTLSVPLGAEEAERLRRDLQFSTQARQNDRQAASVREAVLAVPPALATRPPVPVRISGS